jgi:uncharacterized protein
MEFEQAKAFILDKLKNGLPAHLSYHSVEHTLDVYHAVQHIAEQEGVSERERTLLLTAALFHDTGFLNGSVEHEKKSCEIAREHLPRFGYTTADIEKICGMIMATKLPQSPQDHLEEILCDADLDYLGRDDFFTIGNKLFAELSMYGIIHNEKEWDALQVRFLEAHHYFTTTAIRLRKEKKEQHLQFLRSKLDPS